MLDRLDAVPTGRHADIDERQRIGTPLVQRLLHAAQALFALKGKVDLEAVGLFLGDGEPLLAEEFRHRLGQCGRGELPGADDLLVVLVDRLLVVDHQDSRNHVVEHSSASAG